MQWKIGRQLWWLICQHGVPVKTIHDQAAEFLRDVLQETAQILGVTQLPTSGRHPATNWWISEITKSNPQTDIVQGPEEDLTHSCLYVVRLLNSLTGKTPLF